MYIAFFSCFDGAFLLLWEKRLLKTVLFITLREGLKRTGFRYWKKIGVVERNQFSQNLCPIAEKRRNYHVKLE